MANVQTFRHYVSTLRDNLALGNATEHTHRPALKSLIEAVEDRIVATNEPRRIECGAPDFVVSRNGSNRFTLGYVEAKDVGLDLIAIELDSNRSSPATENGKQLKRYRASLSNLILTNYTEFRWYVNGELRSTSKLAAPDRNSRLSATSEAIAQADMLLTDFLNHAPDPVSSPQELAKRMARLTHIIRDVVGQSFDLEQASSDLTDLYAAFQDVLVPELSPVAFADMFAQTLAYGLFAARVNARPGGFNRESAARSIPPTNPFLRQLLSVGTGLNLDNEPFVSFVDDLAQLLDNTDMAAVLADFGKRTIRQDPIMHFYETFLAAYDPALRDKRGVYYTPEPVVNYIVKSVDHLLRERFGCAEGLADYSTVTYRTLENEGSNETSSPDEVEKQSHRVLVLDPACGTGSFLYAIVDHLREHYRATNRAGMWPGYVKEHLLPRLLGFELLMAPYAMSHLKLGMQLAGQDISEENRPDWAYDFAGSERLGIYLTNTLDEGAMQESLPGPYRIIAEEANLAAEIKRDMPIMVVLGNPPYSGHSENESKRGRELTWIGDLIDDYKRVDEKPLGERNIKWLQDDYVKFIRFGQWKIGQSGVGILAFITNHSYLDSPTFRGMRQQLMKTFTDIYILDLHGNVNKREAAPDGSRDWNVFDIRQGVSIAIFVKESSEDAQATVHHADLWGTRQAKYETLATSDIATTTWELLEPVSPGYLFKPWDNDLAKQYEQWPKITEIMPVSSPGVVTGQDKLAIRNSKDEMARAAQEFAFPEGIEFDNDLVIPIGYRPFDTRHTYYSRLFITRPRRDVMRHMLAGANIGLITCRQQSESSSIWNRCGVSRSVSESCVISNKTKEINYLFPLYLYPTEEQIDQGLYQPGDTLPNLSLSFTSSLEDTLELTFVCDAWGDLQATFGPEDVLHYIYAVLHSSDYRERYDQFLRADFPRVPLPDGVERFASLARLGRQLAEVFLLESPILAGAQLGFPVAGDNLVEKSYPKYFPPGAIPTGESAPCESGRVYINKSDRRAGKRGQYFEGISPDVWDARIGGYQPMSKWLQDRRGRQLSFDDLNHYARIAGSLAETDRLTSEVDEAVSDWLAG